MNRKKKRFKSLIILALSCVTVLLLIVYNNDVEFTRITEGQTWMGKPDSNFYYYEYVLVKNIFRNKPYDVEQSKMMIAYYDSAGLSIDDLLEMPEKQSKMIIAYYDSAGFPIDIDGLLKMPEIKYYYMYFNISTYATRRYFIEKKGYTYDGNETDLGYIYTGRCKDDSTKWEIEIGRNLGTADNYDKVGGHSTSEFLQNECDPGWYEANKDNELVKYYMGLREKTPPSPKGKAK